MSEPAPYDHYEARSSADIAPGVYRVVGTGERVALLRVTDAEGRRRATGELVRVPRDELAAGFEPARNPDRGFDPVRTARNAASGLFWSVRRLLPI